MNRRHHRPEDCVQRTVCQHLRIRGARGLRGVGWAPMSPVYTLDEAAAQLHKSKRWLQYWLLDHPADKHGQPFYVPLGRTKVFTDSDLARILAACIEDERCRLNSSRQGSTRAIRHRGQSAAPTSDAALTRALARAKNHSPRKSSSGSNGTSKVVSLRPSNRPALRLRPTHT